MNNWLNKLAGTALVILLAIGVCQTALAEGNEEPRVLRVAFPESTGINEIYEDGTYGGATYDWLHEIAKYTGWEYEFITEDPDILLEGMMNSEYDLMGGMFYFDNYESYFNYPDFIMGSNYSLLIYSQDDDTIKSFDLTTLNGKRIGVFKKATSKIERLKKFLDFNNLHCELVYYDDVKEYEGCLESGLVDLMYGSDVYMKDHYNVAAKIEADPYYMVTAHNDPELCEQLSEAMEAIYSADPNFAVELYDKYFPEKYINSITFTKQELDFIAASGTFRVAVIRDQYPLFYEENETIKGIIPACLSLITERTGLSFQYVYADSYEELITLLKSGQADIIGGFLNQDPSADALGLVRTASFASLDSVVLRNKQASPTAEHLIMAVPAERDLDTSTIDDQIVYYSHYEDCLDAVNRGEADYTQMLAAFVEDLYAREFYSNITLMADTNLKEELTFAIVKPVNVTLYSVLNKSVNNLSQAELSGILSQNLLNTRTSTVTLKTLLYTNPVLALSLCVGLVILIAVILLLLNYNKMRTKVMQLKLEKAEETSRAKSDFLSRMSHEIRTPMNAIIGLTNLALMSGEATPSVKQNLTKIESSSKFLLSLLNDVLDMSKIESQKMELSAVPFSLNRVVDQMKNIFSLQAQSKQISLEFSNDLPGQLYIGDEMRLSQVLTNLLSNACKFTDKNGSIALSISAEEATDDSVRIHFSVKDTGTGIKSEDLERIFNSFEQAENKNSTVAGTGLGLSISRNLVRLMGGELRVKSTFGEGSEFYFTIPLPVFHGTLETRTADLAKETHPLSGLHILLAEDNDINAEIAIELLQMQQVTVERAENGQQAVELFSSHPKGYFNLILMDVNMPVKDGLTASKEIRAMDHPDAASIPILAMTANTFQEDRDNAKEAGMTGFLPKPFDVGQLYDALKYAVG